jgi:pyridoxamine 5'-phosphate oxidase
MENVSSSTPDLARMRLDYESVELTEELLAADWPAQFGRWLAEAVAAGVAEPNAMVLATADARGRPSARSVLLKGYDARGFTFFTNYESRKGTELAANPYASVVFPWYALHRQVIAIGAVERTSREESAEYFATRPRGAQLGAWASAQSRPLPDRESLARAWDGMAERFPDEVPVPPHWGGFRLVPTSVEFWQGQRSRLHDRLRFRLVRDEGPAGAAGTWIVERLNP